VTRRSHIFLAGAAAAIVLLALTAGVAVTAIGGSHRRASPASLPPTTEAHLSPKGSTGITPTPPLTNAPTETPVQEQYDAALASGLGTSPSVEIAELARAPVPAFSSAWPPLVVANTPEQWASEFTAGLLDIDFAHQSRSGLGEWLSAEAAPEMLPGVPQQIQDKLLYLCLLDASALGNASPIPDQSTWDRDARSSVRWSVSGLFAQPDPTFAQIVASGWEAVDERFAAEDVSGVLTVTAGRSIMRRDFSMTVYVGSALWHPGYGSVVVGDWKEG
jgi:hypothetical protein